MTAKKKNRTLPFGLIVALLVTAATLVGLYVGGVVFYGSRYFPNTFVGTIKCGNKKAAYLEEKNHRFAEDYLLTIYDRNNDKYHISGMDIDYQYVAMQNEQQIIERQSPFAWPVEAFKSHLYPLERSFTFDEKLLADRVHTLGLFSEEKILPPENAFLTMTADGYEITPEIEGTSPIEENILQEIASAIADQSTLVTLSDACYEKPSIRSDDPSIVSTASQIDGFLASTIHYEIDGVDENLSRERILSMLTVSDDGTVTVDEKKVHSFVQHLASTYNTYGDVREFVTSQGDTVRIGGGDESGDAALQAGVLGNGDTGLADKGAALIDLPADTQQRFPAVLTRQAGEALAGAGVKSLEISHGGHLAAGGPNQGQLVCPGAAVQAAVHGVAVPRRIAVFVGDKAGLVPLPAVDAV